MRRFLNRSGVRVLALAFVVVMMVSAIGCSECNPVTPDNLGLAIAGPQEGDVLIAQQEINIEWAAPSQTLNLIDHFRIYYIIIDSDSWCEIERCDISTRSIQWSVPAGINSDHCRLRIEAWDDSLDYPLAETIGAQFSIISFGEVDHLLPIGPSQIQVGQSIDLLIEAKDQWGNTVLTFDDPNILIHNIGNIYWVTHGHGTVCPNPAMVTPGGTLQYTFVTWINGTTIAFNPIIFDEEAIENSAVVGMVIESSSYEVIGTYSCYVVDN